MSFMFEVYYKAPVDLKREEEITGVVERLGGTLDCRETPNGTGSNAVCLTYEFNELESARAAAARSDNGEITSKALSVAVRNRL